MNIGIIGCGTVAQIMHMPYVAELPEATLFALVDPATDRAETLADRYTVDHVFETTKGMLAAVGDDLDAAIILTPPHTHAEVMVQTLDADIPTLVEKPLALSPDDADRMVAAADGADVATMVAYMKRYEPSYERMNAELADRDEIDHITAYDVDPDHGRIIEEVYDIIPGTLPDSVIEESTRERHENALAAIGSDDDALADDYDWHLEHICHDVNVLRGLFGEIEEIDHVDVYADGRYVTAQLRYEGSIRCVLISGLSERKWFEEFVRVDTPDGMVTLEFTNSFVKNSPAELRLKEGTEELTDATYTPSYDESFKRELKHFMQCVEGTAEVRTTVAEARDDVYLIADLFREYQTIETLRGV